MRPLQRLLGAIDARPPKWILLDQRAELEVMLLLGAWEPNHEGDAEVVGKLGVDPDNLERLCVRLSNIEDTPITRDGSSYCWSSPEDAWALLSSTLTKRMLRHFETVAIDVLGVNDLTYDLPPNDRCWAAVAGPTLNHSKTLREGLSQSLLRLRHHAPTIERRRGAGTVIALVDSIVRQVLTPSWKRWASFEQALWWLAEASPRVFLMQLDTSFATDGGIARVFEEEGDPGLHGAAPHLPLQRALGLLCWLPEWMSGAVEALMRLAELDPPDPPTPRVHPRPLAALESVFHIGDPQTGVDEEERLTTLANLTRRHPARGFQLLLQLTHQLSGGFRPESVQPLYRTRLPARSVASDEVQRTRAVRCLVLAVERADQAPERWMQLIREPVNQRFDDGLAEEVFDHLIAHRDHFDDVAREELSSTIRSELVRLYATSLHQKLDTRRLQLHRILETLEPTDPVLREGWRFRPQNILLEPHSRSDYRSIQVRLDDQRDEAFMRLIGPTPSSGVAELSRLVRLFVDRDTDMRELGRVIARSQFSDDFDAVLLRQRPPVGLEPLVAPFARARSHLVGQGLSWLREIVHTWSSEGRTQDVLDTLLLRWPEPQIWDIVDRLEEPLKTSYWRGLDTVGNHDEQQWGRAITNLLEAENVRTALSTASHRCKQLPLELLIQVLEAVSLHTPQERSHGPHIGYDVVEIFSEIERRDNEGEVDPSFDQDLLHLEFRFITFFEGRTPRRVNAFLEGEPDFFVGLLGYMYRPAGETPGDDVSPAAQRLATNARLVLRHWRSYPGRNENVATREQTLYDWAARVLDLAHSSMLGAAASREVAVLLARVDVGEDELWPSEAVRRLLQEGAYPALRQELWSAVVNDRGVTIRGAYEGGTQEEALVAHHRAAAAALRAIWPATASLHSDLAEHYAELARREDESAHDERQRDGR
ncbi:hypothetical protein [Plesiocystis pacifica]|uniref:hypothetical protein n=1 Tax=Plesiocystis pacifica TaxID=191768 RepID=UPI0012F7D3E6|nr:hypothetical protein [Plesiocystis pacifica]